jgi:Alpha-L-fucosidase.
MGEIKWIQQKKYGMMVHYLKHILPREGEQITDWNQMVDKFPVNEFCEEVESTGAGWLIFPFGQNKGYYCSPNPVLEKLFPGRCSNRDLMMEIAKTLKEKGIKLIAYLPSEVDSTEDKLREVFGWDIDPVDKHIFQERYMEFIRAWSEKFGDLLDGWWFDGCYDSSQKGFCRTHEWNNSRFNYTEWADAAKAGNPDAVIAMCTGAEALGYVSKEQEYIAGEVNTLNHIPTGPLKDGIQWHTLIWLDCFWMHAKKTGPIEPPRFTDEELLNYIKTCNSYGGGVTLNVGIYQDGTMAEATVDQIKRISSAIKEV